MVNILSIDFDYFIDTSAEKRDKFFPDGGDEVPKKELQRMWEVAYENYPEIKGIDITKDYYYIKRFLETYDIKDKNIIVAESHKEIKQLIDKIFLEKTLNVINIDFHHDYYHYFCNGEEYNCGNWLRKLIEDRPDTNVKWIRREDSQTLSLEGEFPFESTTDIKLIDRYKFDYIFLCKSPEWTPPHLYKKFNELISHI
jgi:hypothetical protein